MGSEDVVVGGIEVGVGVGRVVEGQHFLLRVSVVCRFEPGKRGGGGLGCVSGIIIKLLLSDVRKMIWKNTERWLLVSQETCCGGKKIEDMGRDD